jgi:hypothetical protein
MNRKQKILSTTILMAFVLLWFGMTGFSASRPEYKPVADEMIGSSGITWVPKVNYAQLVLTVSRPDGSVFEKKFDSGTTPYLDLSSIYGTGGNDGSYTYELRVVPYTDKKVRKDEAFAADNGRGRRLQPQKVLTQTGYFMVQGGAIVTPSVTSEEGLSRVMDVVHADDVIIQGSLCVGYDCVSGETFDYDTIRLKENNLQIHFDDTSTSAGFSANDWRIVINSASSGGGSYFAIDDSTGGERPFVIEAGSDSNSFYLDDAGRLGLGTSTPIYDVHIVSGDSPTIRLHQDTSYGWTEQKWDIAGNEANFFIRDGTNGSKLPFRIQPAAPTNSIYIKSDGKVGLGTSSPTYALEVSRTGSAANLICNQTDGASGCIVADASHVFIGAKTNHDFRLIANDSVKMTILPDGKIGIGVTSVDAANKLQVDSGARLTTGGVWTDASSIKFKENIKSLTADEAKETLAGLNPVKFNYKTEKEEQYVGFIAEQVPELVATNDREGLSPMDIVAVLTKVVQEQQKSIAELKKEIAELKKNQQ